MSNKIGKVYTKKDYGQVLKGAFNDTDATLSTSSFITSKIGNKIDVDVSDDTETYTFSSNGTTLYVLTLTYTDSTRTQLSSVERTE